jgi:hypothetical protein
MKKENKKTPTSLKNLLDSKHFTKSLFMQTKYKIVETIIENHAHDTIDGIDKCTQIADDVIKAISLVGADMYGRYGDLPDKD